METPPDADQAAPPPAPPSVSRSPTPLRPRLWPTVVVTVSAIPLAVVVSIAAIVIALIADGQTDLMQQPDRLMEWMGEFGSTPLGLLVLFVPGQALFAALALGPGVLSPQPLG